MYLPTGDRLGAFGELARVLKSGDYFATAFQAGDDQLRRAGRTLDPGIEFDIYCLSPAGMEHQGVQAGFQVVFWGGHPADPGEVQAQGYLIARRR